eukprot:6183778-Pleurochrysis_carterae.AAC.1
MDCRPGQSRLTTPRAEKDMVTILSGVEHGYTLGTPIGLFVKNEDQRPGKLSAETHAIARLHALPQRRARKLKRAAVQSPKCPWKPGASTQVCRSTQPFWSSHQLFTSRSARCPSYRRLQGDVRDSSSR